MKKIILLTILLATALLSKEVVLGSEKVSKNYTKLIKLNTFVLKVKL